MFRRNFLLTALLILALPACAAEQKPPVLAGHVARIQESVSLNGQELKSAGALLHVGDVLTTGPDARLEVRFEDGGTLRMGANGKVVIDEFLYDPVKLEGRSLLSIAGGAFAATTAAIAKLENHPYKVRTPLATIGIRGTTFWGGDLENQYGVLVLEGRGVVVETEKGKVELTGPGIGTTLEPGQAPRAPISWPPEKQAAALATVSFK